MYAKFTLSSRGAGFRLRNSDDSIARAGNLLVTFLIKQGNMFFEIFVTFWKHLVLLSQIVMMAIMEIKNLYGVLFFCCCVCSCLG